MSQDIGGASPLVPLPAYLENEQIYCAAPSLSTDDVISPSRIGKVAEIAEAARIERYEENGRRYLQGKQLRILSASLCGPFDKASGWQNPWLPNPISRHDQTPTRLSRARTYSTAGRHGRNSTLDKRPYMEAATHRQAAEEKSYREGRSGVSDDSMECHLSSPQNRTGPQLLPNPSSLEKLSRIVSWAECVGEWSSPEIDKFWVPNQVAAHHASESSKKRSASKEWLRRPPAKKTRAGASQNSIITYTPTPILTEPMRPEIKQASAVARRSVTRSFETTTPSSSPDQGLGGSLDALEHDTSDLSRGDIEIHENQLSCDMLRKPGSRDDVVGQADRKETTFAAPARLVGNDTCDGEETDDIPEFSFYSCADNSFIYQARPIKALAKANTAPVPSVGMASSASSESTSAGTATPPVYHDEVVVLSHTDPEKPGSGSMSLGLDVDGLQHIPYPDGPALEDDLEDESTNPDHTRSDISPEEPIDGDERAWQTCEAARKNENALSPSEDRPESDDNLGSQAQVLGSPNPIPGTVHEVEKTHDVFRDTLLDNGPTPIGEPMEIYQSGLSQCNQETPDDSVLRQSNSTEQEISTDEAAGCNNGEAPDKHTDIISPSNETIPEQKTSQKFQDLSGDSSRLSTTPNNIAHEDINNSMTRDRDVVSEPQCSLSSPRAIDDSFVTRNSGTEQGMGTCTCFLAETYKSPVIRPSQQSPWAQEITGTAHAVARGRGMETAAAVLGAVSAHELPGYSFDLFPAVLPSPSPFQGDEQTAGWNVERRSSTQKSPSTPAAGLSRPTTPVAELSVKSFSTFQLSPPRRVDHPTSCANRGILSGGRRRSAVPNTQLSKRVLFAPLPDGQESGETISPIQSTRATSPPPSQIVDVNGENVDGKYHRHFDAMNRLIDKRRLSRRFSRRLLPSSSQQKPESPSFEAMAMAFREADAQLPKGPRNRDKDEDAGIHQEAHATTAGEAAGVPQSPWQHDSQGIDDVAAVLGNLEQFLDV